MTSVQNREAQRITTIARRIDAGIASSEEKKLYKAATKDAKLQKNRNYREALINLSQV